MLLGRLEEEPLANRRKVLVHSADRLDHLFRGGNRVRTCSNQATRGKSWHLVQICWLARKMFVTFSLCYVIVCSQSSYLTNKYMCLICVPHCLYCLYTISRFYHADTVQFTCPVLEFSQTKMSEGTASSGENSFTSRTLTVTDTLADSRGLSVGVNIKSHVMTHSETQPNMLNIYWQTIRPLQKSWLHCM